MTAGRRHQTSGLLLSGICVAMASPLPVTHVLSIA